MGFAAAAAARVSAGGGGCTAWGLAISRVGGGSGAKAALPAGGSALGRGAFGGSVGVGAGVGSVMGGAWLGGAGSLGAGAGGSGAAEQPSARPVRAAPRARQRALCASAGAAYRTRAVQATSASSGNLAEAAGGTEKEATTHGVRTV